MGDLKVDLKVEYAKSNRSSCKKCSSTIEKDEMRFGKLERATNFDGEIYHWHHLKCFVSKHGNLVGSVSDIKGAGELKWDDQQKLSKQFGGGVGGDDDEEDEDEETGVDGYCVEYAKSGRAKCNKCYSAIGNKEVRIGEHSTDQYNGYSQTRWFHLDCFEVPVTMTAVSEISGSKNLNAKDKKKVEDLISAAIKKNGKKRKQIDDEKQDKADKKQKTVDEAKEKADKIWALKDKLKNKYSLNDLKAILKHNDQYYTGGKEELVARIADGELNGKLPKCTECKTGFLVFEAGDVVCHGGHLSAWSKCAYKGSAEDVKRNGTWKTPSADKIVDLIAEIKDDAQKEKEMPTTTTSSETKSARSKPSKLNADLFKDSIVAIVGDVEKDSLTETINSQGGTVVATVTKKVTLLIATYEEVSKGKPTTKVANAIKYEIPIVSELFVQNAVNEGHLKTIDKFLLWKDGAAVKIDKSSVTIAEPSKESAVAKKASGPKTRKKLAVPPVDPKSECKNGTVLEDNGDVYATMLNKTDVNQGQSGANSFYFIQIIQSKNKKGFFLFRKWGRVGQEGSSTEAEYSKKSDAIAEFKAIFYKQTGGTFDQFLEDDFEKRPGKMYPIELEGEEESNGAEESEKVKKARKVLTTGCQLDVRVQNLVKLLFDTNMFKEQMKELKLDTKKMPLGKISKKQLAKGIEVLEEIDEELNKSKPSLAMLTDATNRFYTLVPHDFGAEKPPIIGDKASLQKKFDLIEILGDIEVAARMLEEEGKLDADPVTQQYEQLKNKIEPLEKDSDEYKRIQTFWDNSKQGRSIFIDEIFKVKRDGEETLFSKFDDLENRKLLWHGSSVAVFAAILSGGLKIMPHAGGRVGKGLYFADMIDKSAQYLGYHGTIGMVLLNEVALGKIHRIQHDDSSLVKPPGKNNSVLAEGSMMPNPKDDYLDYKLSHTQHPVAIPQGKSHNSGVKGSFHHNEFLVYDQTQVTMKYLIKIRNGSANGW